MRTAHKAKVDQGREALLPSLCDANGKKMKAMFIEPFLVAASSLLWIIVLPFAALVCSGIAISDRVEALKAREAGASWKQPEMRAAARPTSPT